MKSSDYYFQTEVGPMQNFVYFLGSKDHEDILVVDPGWESPQISKLAQEQGKKISGILCTHHHFDHVNGIEDLLKEHDVPVYMLDKEIDFYNWSCENLKRVSAGDTLNVGRESIKILHTPGHTKGSASYLFNHWLVTGDTLFINGCGRCDLLGGDPETMYETLSQLVNNLSSDTIVLPGHDYGPQKTDSLEQQKKTNPYLKFDSLKGFLGHRMR